MNDNIGAIFNPDSFGNRSNHVPSRVQPDTLYNFVTKIDYIIDSLLHKRIAPRFSVEDIRYLNIPPKIAAIPMTCFCDINLSKIEYHMEFYGNYGLAFNKSWCMERGVQPVQYLNKSSDLQKEFRKAFNASYYNSNMHLTESKPYISLLNFLTNQMIYYKPYQGKFPILDKDGNRSSTKKKMKCFADECEWRYIPDLSKIGISQIITDEVVVANWKQTYDDLLSNEESVTFNFEYADLKYIVIKDTIDFRKLIEKINEWGSNKLISDKELYDLLPKILIWDEIKGDF
ncbi:MAG: hypothetical protein J6U54_22440 [Clostridiales bacterium]|nr:hypothetical protein [Clostridiales bacterium]